MQLEKTNRTKSLSFTLLHLGARFLFFRVSTRATLFGNLAEPLYGLFIFRPVLMLHYRIFQSHSH